MNTYTVETRHSTVTVRGTSMVLEGSGALRTLIVKNADDKAAAIFQDWNYVTVERDEEPEGTAAAGPDSNTTRITVA